MPHIIEDVFDTDTYFVQHLVAQRGWSVGERNMEGYDAVHLVYLDGEYPRLITGEFIRTNEEFVRFGFVDLFERLEHGFYPDLLLLASFYIDGYRPMEHLSALLFDPETFEFDHRISDILALSKGYLIYRFQYDLVMQSIFGISASNAEELRKRFFKGEADWSHGCPSEPLEEFLRLHLRRGVGRQYVMPNFIGAKHLLDFHKNR